MREWLRSQAAAGYVSYDPAAERFGLAPGVAAVLCDGPLAGLADGMAAQFAVWWAQLDRYEAAFRTGEGIAWGTMPAAHAEGMDMITRAVVAPALVGEWLPAVDGIVARLSAGAVVADVRYRCRHCFSPRGRGGFRPCWRYAGCSGCDAERSADMGRAPERNGEDDDTGHARANGHGP